MKEHHKIAIAGLIFGAITFILINFVGCTTTAEEKNNKKSIENISDIKHEKHSCCEEEEVEELTDGSIYQLESEWINQDKKEFRLNDLKGKNVVLTMFFASCSYACPILINDMKKIESALPEDELGDYKFVLVSIDPERDTPEALKTTAKRFSLDTNRWTLLTGSADDVMELAALIGFKYKKDANGDYSHSNLITLLNEEGEIVHQHLGLNKDVAQAVNVLNNLN